MRVAHKMSLHEVVDLSSLLTSENQQHTLLLPLLHLIVPNGLWARIFHELCEIARIQRSFMSGSDHHFWGTTRAKRLSPPRGTQAPRVAGLEASKPILGVWGREVVTYRLGVREKCLSYANANSV